VFRSSVRALALLYLPAVVALIKGEITMTIIEKLHANLPGFKDQIRKSRSYSSALIAPSVESNRSALVAEADDDGRYLVTTFLCGPRLVDSLGLSGVPADYEYRLYSWTGVVKFVSAFLNGNDVEELCAIATKSSSHRSDLRGWSDIVA